MTANELEALILLEKSTSNDKDDEYSIPLDISDILHICREYNKLGWQIQNQVDSILEVGVEESIRSGNVRKESLPLIENFLHRICDNAYFGDAVAQAQDCIELIREYKEKYNVRYAVNFN
jgi:hypothetical protein